MIDNWWSTRAGTAKPGRPLPLPSGGTDETRRLASFLIALMEPRHPATSMAPTLVTRYRSDPWFTAKEVAERATASGAGRYSTADVRTALTGDVIPPRPIIESVIALRAEGSAHGDESRASKLRVDLQSEAAKLLAHSSKVRSRTNSHSRRGLREWLRIRSVSLTQLERIVALAVGTATLLGAIGGGFIAIRHFFSPSIPWRVRADQICLRYIDDDHEAQYRQEDLKTRFDLWPQKLQRLWDVKVPVEYELDWRKYLNSEGDIETVYAESYKDRAGDFDYGRLNYYLPTLEEDLKNIQNVTKELNLQVCGNDMGDSGWFAIFPDGGAPTSTPTPSAKMSLYRIARNILRMLSLDPPPNLGGGVLPAGPD
jgi:hypothetical protein